MARRRNAGKARNIRLVRNVSPDKARLTPCRFDLGNQRGPLFLASAARNHARPSRRHRDRRAATDPTGATRYDHDLVLHIPVAHRPASGKPVVRVTRSQLSIFHRTVRQAHAGAPMRTVSV